MQGDEMFAAVVAKPSGAPATVQIYYLEDADIVYPAPLRSITVPGCNLTCALWSAPDAPVTIAGDDGYVRDNDSEEKKELRRVQLHSKAINSIVFS
jgi:hypothetical protein